MSSSKKLPLSSGIFICLTSIVGAGIFIKTQTLNTLSHGHVFPTLVLFFIFLINIFVFTFVLIKITPLQSGNMGFMEWSRRFCSRSIDVCFSNFVRFFYHPVSLVIFSTFGVMGILGERTGIGTIPIMLLSFFAVLFFMTINLISFRWAKKLQFVLWMAVLIPLLILPIIGMCNRPTEDELANIPEATKATGLDGIGPWMILISGLPSVLFIYDGFYSLAALKDRLKSLKILSISLVVSFVLVTFLYLYVIIGFRLGNPKSANYKEFPIFKQRSTLKELFEIFVGCASFLTLNSICLSNIPQLVAMHNANGYRDVKWVTRSFFYKKHEDHEFQTKFSIWIYLMFKTIGWFILIGIMSMVLNKFAYRNPGEKSQGLIDLLDSLADITSVFVFGILATVIFKSLTRLRNSNFSTTFKLCAITSSSLIVIAILYLVVSYCVGSTGYNGSSVLVSSMKLILLLVFFVGSFGTKIYAFFDRIINRRKYLLYPRFPEGSSFTLS